MSQKSATKFALVLDKRADPAELLTATWLAAQKLMAAAQASQRAQMQFIDFRDADGESHAPISARPLVVLRGMAGDIRKAMTSTTGENGAGVVSAAIAGADATACIAVLFFGPHDAVTAITRRFSLWQT